MFLFLLENSNILRDGVREREKVLQNFKVVASVIRAVLASTTQASVTVLLILLIILLGGFPAASQLKPLCHNMICIVDV